MRRYLFHILIQLTFYSLTLKADAGETDNETTTTKNPPTTAESMNKLFFI